MKKRIISMLAVTAFTGLALVGCASNLPATISDESAETTALPAAEELTTEESTIAESAAETTKAPTSAAGQARTLEEIKESGKIEIGVFSDKNPFGYVDENGEVQGYDVYFAKRLGEELFGSEEAVEFVFVEAANRVEYLKSAKVDIILANFTVTEERSEQVDFALPYMKVALGVVSPENALITDVAELEDKKLIVVKGTTAETYFTANHPEVELVKYDEYQEAYDALLDGRGDAFSTDNTEVLAWALRNEGFEVGIETLGGIDSIAPAVQKGNTELLNWLNEVIKDLGQEQFFHENFDATLKQVYGDSVQPENIVVEGGEL